MFHDADHSCTFINCVCVCVRACVCVCMSVCVCTGLVEEGGG